MYEHRGRSFYLEIPTLNDRMESSFVSWRGDDYLLVGVRPTSVASSGSGVEIYRIVYSEKSWQVVDLVLVNKISTDLGLISCISDGDQIYIIGSTDWGSPNQVKIVKTTDLATFIDVGTIVTSNDQTKFFNSSIGKIGETYIVACEISAPHLGFRDFSIEFYSSVDLVNWTRIGVVFKPDIYAACPFLHVSDDNIYIEWLSIEVPDNQLVFFPRLSRTKDFLIFEDAPDHFLDTKTMGNGINMSDIDMMYTHGRVLMAYAESNQSSGADAYTNIRLLSVTVPMETFLKSYFE